MQRRTNKPATQNDAQQHLVDCVHIAEGSYNRGRNRPARYHTALGSLREVLACFEVGAALGYLPEVQPDLGCRIDHVLGTLVRLVGGH